MGMTAPAIYRYFPSLDALVHELTEDLYIELREAIESARATVPADDPLTQLTVMARAFRRWSVGHPREFELIFGNPVPGVVEFESSCDSPHHAGARAGAPFLEALTRLWQQSPFPTPPAAVIAQKLGPYLGPYEAMCDQLPVEVIYTYLASWTRLYGMVAMEVFGHLRWAMTTVEPLFEIELATFRAQFGDQPPAAGTAAP